MASPRAAGAPESFPGKGKGKDKGKLGGKDKGYKNKNKGKAKLFANATPWTDPEGNSLHAVWSGATATPKLGSDHKLQISDYFKMNHHPEGGMAPISLEAPN